MANDGLMGVRPTGVRAGSVTPKDDHVQHQNPYLLNTTVPATPRTAPVAEEKNSSPPKSSPSRVINWVRGAIDLLNSWVISRAVDWVMLVSSAAKKPTEQNKPAVSAQDTIVSAVEAGNDAAAIPQIKQTSSETPADMQVTLKKDDQIGEGALTQKATQNEPQAGDPAAILSALKAGNSAEAIAQIKATTPQELADMQMTSERGGQIITKNLLRWAITEGHTEIANALIKQMDAFDLGKDFKGPYDRGTNALSVALAAGKSEIAEKLIEKMGPGVLEATKVNNQELVQWLVSNNLTDLLSALGKRSQGLLKKISDSQAAQVKAQEVKQAQAAEQVKAQKIEARRVEVRQGLRAILASYRYNQDEAYERDLDAQVNALNLTADDLGLIDENGWNALMWLLNGTLNTVQLGFTPSFNPRIELARKLIGKMHPKDLAQVDKSGKTALTLAIKNKREEIAAEIAKEMLYRDLNSSYRNLAQTEGFNHLDEVLRERITDNAINLASLDDSRAYRP